MTYRPEHSTDVQQVLQSLSNGLRSDVEIAKTARLLLDRVQIALLFLIADRCVVESADGLFRLTDNGNDMVKKANALELEQGAAAAVLAEVMTPAPQTTRLRRRNLPS